MTLKNIENPRLHSDRTLIFVQPSKGPALIIENINQAIIRIVYDILYKSIFLLQLGA